MYSCIAKGLEDTTRQAKQLTVVILRLKSICKSIASGVRNCQMVSPTTGDAPVAPGLTSRISAASGVFWGKMDKLVALARRRLGERGAVPPSETGVRKDNMLASRSRLSPRVIGRTNGVSSGREVGDWGSSDVDAARHQRGQQPAKQAIDLVT